jgi:two-component system, OmpR family, sensor histidine kinase KdpD
MKVERNKSILSNLSLRNQYYVSIAVVILTALLCYPLSILIGYRAVALLLLVAVSSTAMVFEIFPVLVAATLSALIWNFFFIPPRFTFHIGDAEDWLLFAMYFLISLLHAVLTFKIRIAEKMNREKEEKVRSIHLYNTILHSLSHEMRTPLSTLLGSVETLKEEDQKLTTLQKNELYGQISQSGEQLNRQVENLLNMSRLQNGMMILNKEWCDVNDLIRGVIYKLNKEIGQHRIIFKPNDDLPLFKLDIGLIEQVLLNLLHNALKYTFAESTINIRASVTENQGILEIEDNGAGYPDDILNNAFAIFQRGKNAKKGGLGLGLSIAKGVVDAHDGTIKIGNLETGGAFCRITVPCEFSYIGNLTLEN